MVTTIAFIISVSIIITHYFEPTIYLIGWLHDHIPNKKNILLKVSTKILSCSKCLSFWLSIGLLQDFYIAITIALVTNTLSLLLNKL